MSVHVDERIPDCNVTAPLCSTTFSAYPQLMGFAIQLEGFVVHVWVWRTAVEISMSLSVPSFPLRAVSRSAISRVFSFLPFPRHLPVSSLPPEPRNKISTNPWNRMLWRRTSCEFKEI